MYNIKMKGKTKDKTNQRIINDPNLTLNDNESKYNHNHRNAARWSAI